tara:strand:- start:2113 stop:2355 length:243 start_codon:yes stop_codon:yes gene_type:complete
LTSEKITQPNHMEILRRQLSLAKIDTMLISETILKLEMLTTAVDNNLISPQETLDELELLLPDCLKHLSMKEIKKIFSSL